MMVLGKSEREILIVMASLMQLCNFVSQALSLFKYQSSVIALSFTLC